MELLVSCCSPLALLLALVLVQWAWPCVCFTVEFPSERPLSVALSRTLVLEATIKKTPEETVMDLAWNMVEGRPGQTGSKFRVYPPARNARVSVEQDGATLRVLNLTKEDYGIYTITVTDDAGRQASARRIVRESEVAPRVSVPLLCEVSEQWDIPKFVWLADGVEVPNSTHNLSADGSKLYPSGTCVRNYTCTVSSSLGTSSNHFYNTGCDTNADKPETGCHDCTTPWVLVGILSAILVSVIINCVWRKCRHRNTDPPASIPEQRQNLQDDPV